MIIIIWNTKNHCVTQVQNSDAQKCEKKRISNKKKILPNLGTTPDFSQNFPSKKWCLKSEEYGSTTMNISSSGSQDDSKNISQRIPQEPCGTSLQHSMHAPGNDQTKKLPTLYAGIMCATVKGLDEQIQEDIKSALSVLNIKHINIEKVFHHGNNFFMVAIDNEIDRDKLVNYQSLKLPKFIKCYDLDLTLGIQRIKLLDIPEEITEDKIIEAIEINLGSVTSFEFKFNRRHTDTVATVEIAISDVEFTKAEELPIDTWKIKWRLVNKDQGRKK
jgi:hypothetical protein